MERVTESCKREKGVSFCARRSLTLSLSLSLSLSLLLRVEEFRVGSGSHEFMSGKDWQDFWKKERSKSVFFFVRWWPVCV